MTAAGEACVRVIYRGWVQGVGFRYTAASHARKFDVAGYVRNLPDRTVELVVQGRQSEIDDLLAQIGRSFEGNIAEQSAGDFSPAEPLAGFEIRR